MAKSQAVVVTKHGSRYLQQLCKHWAHKFAVEFTPEAGRIDLGDGRIVTMSAAADALTVDAEADNIKQLEEVVQVHIVRFAFREELVFDWKAA